MSISVHCCRKQKRHQTNLKENHDLLEIEQNPQPNQMTTLHQGRQRSERDGGTTLTGVAPPTTMLHLVDYCLDEGEKKNLKVALFVRKGGGGIEL